jgi:hypothetical protein
MILSNSLQGDIGDDAADAANESREHTGEQGATRLRGKATTQPGNEAACGDQHDPGQLYGEKAKLVMQLILGDEVRLCSSDHDKQPSYQNADGKRQGCSTT